jgi:hypothetical protein
VIVQSVRETGPKRAPVNLRFCKSLYFNRDGGI